jgi:hypothetical protein
VCFRVRMAEKWTVSRYRRRKDSGMLHEVTQSVKDACEDEAREEDMAEGAEACEREETGNRPHFADRHRTVERIWEGRASGDGMAPSSPRAWREYRMVEGNAARTDRTLAEVSGKESFHVVAALCMPDVPPSFHVDTVRWHTADVWVALPYPPVD